MAKQLAAVVDNLDGVDEALHEMYTQAQDGKFVLNIAGRPRGFAPDSDLTQFRDNNTTLTATNTELTTKLAAFDGVDVELFKRLKAVQDDLDSKAMVKAGDIAGLVAAELKKEVDPLKAELAIEKAARVEAQGIANSAIVDAKVLTAAADLGKIRTGAGDVIVAKAKTAGWQNVGGELLQMDGETVVGRDIKDWVTSNAGKDGNIAFCFEASIGAGGDGDKGLPGDTSVKHIAFTDKKAVSDNLEDIATGKVVVDPLAV